MSLPCTTFHEKKNNACVSHSTSNEASRRKTYRQTVTLWEKDGSGKEAEMEKRQRLTSERLSREYSRSSNFLNRGAHSPCGNRSDIFVGFISCLAA